MQHRLQRRVASAVALALAVVALLAAVPATPAAANTGVGLFTGAMWLDSPLFFSVDERAPLRWSMVTDSCLTSIDEAHDPGWGCGLSAAGMLESARIGGADPIGPSCVAASGSGVGGLSVSGEDHDLGLHWEWAIGSVIPMLSTPSAADPSPDGRAVVFVRLRPGGDLDCSSTSGAGAFTFIAVAAVLSH